jgi:hypothetical protein
MKMTDDMALSCSFKSISNYGEKVKFIISYYKEHIFIYRLTLTKNTDSYVTFGSGKIIKKFKDYFLIKSCTGFKQNTFENIIDIFYKMKNKKKDDFLKSIGVK